MQPRYRLWASNQNHRQWGAGGEGSWLFPVWDQSGQRQETLFHLMNTSLHHMKCQFPRTILWPNQTLSACQERVLFMACFSIFLQGVLRFLTATALLVSYLQISCLSLNTLDGLMKQHEYNGGWVGVWILLTLCYGFLCVCLGGFWWVPWKVGILWSHSHTST